MILSVAVLPHVSVAVTIKVLAAQFLTKLLYATMMSAAEEQSSVMKVLVEKKLMAYSSLVNHLEPSEYSEIKMTGGLLSKEKDTVSSPTLPHLSFAVTIAVLASHCRLVAMNTSRSAAAVQSSVSVVWVLMANSRSAMLL